MKNKVHNYPNPDLLETGEKIRALRESRDMSQEQLALLLDTTKNSISKYENGQMEMKISIPEWIEEVVNTFEKITVGIRKV